MIVHARSTRHWALLHSAAGEHAEALALADRLFDYHKNALTFGLK